MSTLHPAPEVAALPSLTLRHYPDPILRERIAPVQIVSPHLDALIPMMMQALSTFNAIGLAANQVGYRERVFVMQCHHTSPARYFINPQIVQQEGQSQPRSEGCLSFPQLRVELSRSDRILLQFQDLDLNTHTEWFDGIEAVCIQHELDHLNGIVFTDLLKPVKRQLTLKRYLKNR